LKRAFPAARKIAVGSDCIPYYNDRAWRVRPEHFLVSDAGHQLNEIMHIGIIWLEDVFFEKAAIWKLGA
jgi:hypothetical protein